MFERDFKALFYLPDTIVITGRLIRQVGFNIHGYEVNTFNALKSRVAK